MRPSSLLTSAWNAWRSPFVFAISPSDSPVRSRFGALYVTNPQPVQARVRPGATRAGTAVASSSTPGRRYTEVRVRVGWTALTGIGRSAAPQEGYFSSSSCSPSRTRS